MLSIQQVERMRQIGLEPVPVKDWGKSEHPYWHIVALDMRFGEIIFSAPRERAEEIAKILETSLCGCGIIKELITWSIKALDLEAEWKAI